MKETKLAILVALLGSGTLQISDEGSAILNQEQLGKIEAGLKRLQDENPAAEADLAAANSAKDAAEKALSDAVKAMDDLDATIKAADTPAAKVEAIRAKAMSA